ETRTMQAKNGLRLNDLRRTEQARPELGHPAAPGHCRAVEGEVAHAASDAELMAEEQVLDFKPAPRLEEVEEKHCERLQEGNLQLYVDDATIWPVSGPMCCTFNACRSRKFNPAGFAR